MYIEEIITLASLSVIITWKYQEKYLYLVFPGLIERGVFN